jgi:hypothetical protein
VVKQETVEEEDEELVKFSDTKNTPQSKTGALKLNGLRLST